jgi:hypothetical protein
MKPFEPPLCTEHHFKTTAFKNGGLPKVACVCTICEMVLIGTLLATLPPCANHYHTGTKAK